MDLNNDYSVKSCRLQILTLYLNSVNIMDLKNLPAILNNLFRISL